MGNGFSLYKPRISSFYFSASQCFIVVKFEQVCPNDLFANVTTSYLKGKSVVSTFVRSQFFITCLCKLKGEELRTKVIPNNCYF